MIFTSFGECSHDVNVYVTFKPPGCTHFIHPCFVGLGADLNTHRTSRYSGSRYRAWTLDPWFGCWEAVTSTSLCILI